MFSNRLTLAALAVACILAAGAGGYLASKQNAVPAPAAAASAPVANLSPSTATTRPVQETEAVVEPSKTDRNKAEATGSSSSASQTTAAARQNGKADVSRSQPKAAKAAGASPVPPLDRSWPSTAPAAPPQAPAPAPATPAVAEADPKVETPVQELPKAPEPPQKTFEELVVSANSVIGLQTETRLSSETARVEDRVEARVTRDVKVGSSVAIPAGSRAIGSVTQVDRGGKFKEKARLAIRFNTLLLPDGTRLSMSTDTIYREGEAPSNGAAAKVGGGAAAGAILGAILGGAKGAAAGAALGGGGGAAVAESGDRNAVTVPAGTPLTVRLLSPLSVTVEHN